MVKSPHAAAIICLAVLDTSVRRADPTHKSTVPHHAVPASPILRHYRRKCEIAPTGTVGRPRLRPPPNHTGEFSVTPPPRHDVGKVGFTAGPAAGCGPGRSREVRGRLRPVTPQRGCSLCQCGLCAFSLTAGPAAPSASPQLRNKGDCLPHGAGDTVSGPGSRR